MKCAIYIKFYLLTYLKGGGAHIKVVVIPTLQQFLLFLHPGCKYPKIKVESLYLKHILIVSFQIQCGGVQSQNDQNCVNVQIWT